MVRIKSVMRLWRTCWPYVRHVSCLCALLYIAVVASLAISVISRHALPHSWSFDVRCGTLIIARSDERLAPGAPKPTKATLDQIPMNDGRTFHEAMQATDWNWWPEALQFLPSDTPGVLHMPTCMLRAFSFVKLPTQAADEHARVAAISYLEQPTKAELTTESGAERGSMIVISLLAEATKASFLALFISVLFVIAACATWRAAYANAKDVFKDDLDEYDAATSPAALAWYASRMVGLPLLVFVLAVFMLTADGLLMKHRA
jgi:hypothetical protein